jgi:hypothetical protein
MALRRRDPQVNAMFDKQVSDAGVNTRTEEPNAGRKRLEDNPRINNAIVSAGMSAKDYFVAAIAIAQAERFMGDPKSAPPTPTMPQNAEFLRQHQAGLAKIHRIEQTAGTPATAVTGTPATAPTPAGRSKTAPKGDSARERLFGVGDRRRAGPALEQHDVPAGRREMDRSAAGHVAADAQAAWAQQPDVDIRTGDVGRDLGDRREPQRIRERRRIRAGESDLRRPGRVDQDAHGSTAVRSGRVDDPDLAQPDDRRHSCALRGVRGGTRAPGAGRGEQCASQQTRAHEPRCRTAS